MHILFMLLVKNLNVATFSSGNFTFFSGFLLSERMPFILILSIIF